MKIRSFKLTGHPGVGDIDLNFSDATGGIFNTVVLAGGNGTGKTAVLDAIQRTFEGELGGNFGKVILQLQFDARDLAKLAVALNAPPPQGVTEYTLEFDSQKLGDWSASQLRWNNPQTGNVQSTVAVLGADQWRGLFRSFFSEAAVNFHPERLTAVTAQIIDDPNQGTTRSGPALGKQIAQLIIDIRAADSEDLSNWVHDHPGQVPPSDIVDARFIRFREAFEYIFPAKRFSKISRDDGKLLIEFEEFGRTSTLDQLSTGEKQIIFRAGFLLRSKNVMHGSIVLIDEPELGLHPEWQERISGFYTHLLMDHQGHHPQLILSTHSPFIVHGAANARVVILEKNRDTGAISEMASPHYPSVHGSDAVRAFNVDSFLASAQKQLLVLTEGQSDADIFYAAWDKLYPREERKFELRAALGDKNVQITLNDNDLFARVGQNRLILGVFDFDKAYDHWNGVWRKTTPASALVSAIESDGLVKRHGSEKGWAMLLPVPSFRSDWASTALKGSSILSVEFLFQDADLPSHMIGQKALPKGQTQPFFKSSEKSAFASLAASLPPSSFSAFKPLFERWMDILEGRL